MNAYDRYAVESAERLDLRYYRIHMHGRTWIVDYSNPRDLRLFFPGLFPAETSRYRIWDESLLDADITARRGRQVRKYSMWTKWLFLAFVFDCMFMPAPLNIHLLTVDPRIGEHWGIVTVAILLTELIIMLILSRCWSSTIALDDRPSQLMVQVDDPMRVRGRSKAFIVIRWIFYAFLLVGGAAVVAMWGSSSYAAVIGLFIPLTAGLMFERFCVFAPLTDTRKYRIIDPAAPINHHTPSIKERRTIMLPMGSIVYLTGGDQKLMIIGKGPIIGQRGRKVFFDYVGVPYPVGFDPDRLVYFHDADVDEVVFRGYSDQEQDRIDAAFTEWVDDPNNTTPRGTVE